MNLAALTPVIIRNAAIWKSMRYASIEGLGLAADPVQKKLASNNSMALAADAFAEAGLNFR